MREIFLSSRLVVRSLSVLMLACFTLCYGIGAQKTVTLIQQVNQASAPPILWSAPEAIPFGTPLSALQLDATSAAAGTFAYQPGSGTILPAGTGSLSVIFSPLDQNYQAGSASVPIVVVPPGSSSFTVTPNGNSPANPLRLQPGVPATVQLAVAPIGDFHQPITLSCRFPLMDRVCLFSPEVIRPTTTPVQVTLTLEPFEGAAPSRSAARLLPPNGSVAGGLLPSIMASALFGMFTFRRRLRMPTGRLATASVLLVFPFLALLSGCGTEFGWRTGQIEVQARSLMETRIVPIYVVDEVPFPAELRQRQPIRGMER